MQCDSKSNIRHSMENRIGILPPGADRLCPGVNISIGDRQIHQLSRSDHASDVYSSYINRIYIAHIYRSFLFHDDHQNIFQLNNRDGTSLYN